MHCITPGRTLCCTGAADRRGRPRPLSAAGDPRSAERTASANALARRQIIKTGSFHPRTPAASSLPSGEKAIEWTLQPSTGNRFRSVPVARLHIRVEPFSGLLADNIRFGIVARRGKCLAVARKLEVVQKQPVARERACSDPCWRPWSHDIDELLYLLGGFIEISDAACGHKPAAGGKGEALIVFVLGDMPLTLLSASREVPELDPARGFDRRQRFTIG